MEPPFDDEGMKRNLSGRKRKAAEPSSSSSPSRTIDKRTFDIFLSFRGEDTRKGFTSHLYNALRQRGISTFIDNEELETGERIKELFRYIEASKIFVPVLSERYADSRWCLKEITKMVECGRPILPIFFHVDPKDVRNQSGPFEVSFQGHESSNKVGEAELIKWKQALKAVGEIKGHSFQENTNGTEAELIREVVKEISRKLIKTARPINDNLVGMDSHIDKMYSRLNLTDNEVKMIGIVGMGGVGKTTIASVVYNKLLSDFEDTSFIENVREGFKQHNGGVASQQRLIKDILKDEHSDIYSVKHGASLIEERLRSKRVLVILDDADHIEQLEALAGKTDWFGSGSRIIITSRDSRLLLNHGVKEEDIYRPKPLDDDNSLRLFHSHAFRGLPPTDSEYLLLSGKVVELTGGLPLALKVLGSFLRGRDIIQWKETVADLKQVPNGEIDRCLRISYEGFEEKVKQIFLDISCFFIGERKEDITCMWEYCGLQSETPIAVLQERSLITINMFDEFEMHDLLRDMGRGIVAQQGKPWQRSRLWNLDDLMEIFDCKAVWTMAEGIVIASGDWEGLVNTPADDSKTHLSTEAFFDFSSLRVLHLSWFAFEGEFLRLPRRLKWLRLSDCDFVNRLSGASNLNAISVLELSEVGDVDRIMMVLSSSSSEAFHALKVLRLESLGMTRTPDFSKMKCLRKLILLDLLMLTEVDGSIGSLKSLVHLELIDCRRLQRLPDSICTLNSLQILLLMGCPDLSLPEKLGDMKSLRELRFEDTGMRKIPDSIYDLSNLRTLSLDDVSCLPDSMRTLDSLEKLYIKEFERKNLIDLDSVLRFDDHDYLEWFAVIPNSSCEKVKELTIERDDSTEELPPYLGRLTNLEALSIRCGNLRALPEWLGQLQKLESLELDCDILEALPEWLGQLHKLKSLKLECYNMKALPESLGQLQKLESLTLLCCGLEALPESLGQLQKLESLTLLCCGLEALPEWLGQLQKLKSLELFCDNLKALPESLGQLQKLESLELNCNSLEALPESLGQLQKLESLELNCNSLEALPESLGQLQKLKSLKLFCDNLKALPESLGQLQKLESLKLKCYNLKALPESLGQLQKLESLELDCDSLEALPESLGQLQKFESLELDCVSLKALPESLGQLQKFESLELDCDSLEALPATAGRTFENLKSLFLTCWSIEHIPDWIASLGRLEKLSLNCVVSLPSSLSNLTQLQELRLYYYYNESLPPLPSSLRVLHARDCGNLRTISDVSNLKSLRELNLEGCRLLGDFCGLESIAHNLETLELPGPCGGLSMFSRLSPAFMTRLFKEAAFSSLKTFRVFGSKQCGEEIPCHLDNHEPFWITFPKVGRGGKRPTQVVWKSSFDTSEELSLSISIVEEDGHVIYRSTQKHDVLCKIGGEEIVGYSREGSYLRMQVSASASNLKEITQLMSNANLFVEYT